MKQSHTSRLKGPGSGSAEWFCPFWTCMGYPGQCGDGFTGRTARSPPGRERFAGMAVPADRQVAGLKF